MLALATLFLSGCFDSGGLGVELVLQLKSELSVEQLDYELVSLTGDSAAVRGSQAIPPSENLVERPYVLTLSPLAPDSYRLVLRGVHDDSRTQLAVRCYELDASLTDQVGLVFASGSVDSDGDGFPTDPMALCREFSPDGGLRECTEEDAHLCELDLTIDCAEGDPDIYPGAPVVCRNGIDENCDGEDEPCEDSDGDGYSACPPESTSICDCDDSDPTISPDAEETANAAQCNDGIDQDCDGRDACCDADGDGSPACRECGDIPGVPEDRVGERCLDDLDCVSIDPVTRLPTNVVVGSCAVNGAGTGDCVEDVSECTRSGCDPATIFPGADEACDGFDNDCDALVDEAERCRAPDLDADGAPLCGHPAADPSEPCEAAEFDCDAGLSPLARELCGGGLDEDLDGMLDEGCPALDSDGDGQAPPRDCDDSEALAYDRSGFGGFTVPDIDICGNGQPESCLPGDDRPCSEDLDADGYVERVPAYCEGDPTSSPDVAEVCDGVDNDCDLVVDEVLDPTMSRGCVGGSPVDYATDPLHCGGCRAACEIGSDADACVDGACDCSAEPGISGCVDVLRAELGREPVSPACDAACGGCADLDSDPSNCGACGQVCGAGETCEGGLCTCGATSAPSPGVDACDWPVECCGGACVSRITDPANCGACGFQCGPHTVCNMGVCGCDPATPQWVDCDGDVALAGGNGCETDLSVPNDRRCGACDNDCRPNASCDGSLVCSCNAGQLDCAPGAPWCETVFSTSDCGGCGVSCGSGETCDARGRCACGSTVSSVGGGRACPGGQTCAGGTCS